MPKFDPQPDRPESYQFYESPKMKIKEGYKIRQIAGENVVVMQGTLGADMTRIISLNDSGAWLWRELSGKDFSVEDVAELLCCRYDVEPATAMEDASRWTETLKECKAIEL